MQQSLEQRLADELRIRPEQVRSTVTLLDDGATVPFIARYRKEVTGGLDDTQLRTLAERLEYLRALAARRQTILNSIRAQEKLTPELERAIQQAETKTHLEDLYLPYKPKRRTKAQIAREAGLAPLAEALFADPTLVPEQVAADYVDAEKDVADSQAALAGARAILMERFSEAAPLLGQVRDYLWHEGLLRSRSIDGQEDSGAKFRDYFAYDEPLKAVPSHRALAVFRGRNEGVLQLSIRLPNEPDNQQAAHPCEQQIAEFWRINDQGRAADSWLAEVVRWTWRVKLLTQLETELMTRLRERAEQEAIQVFANNVHDLLLAAPAGPRPTMGLDPGLKTGVKVAIVDGTGKLVEHTTIFPHPPQKRWRDALGTLATLCLVHQVELISIGNGTASRETERLVAKLIGCYPRLRLTKVVVSEAGASVYSASALAAREFPDLDVTIRGAVSIARRLQDPLAELVKIEPKAIGVGQYQHDVSQAKLARSLDAVVEDCVNAVGVDANTASSALLARVAGLNRALADNIVAFRDQHGAFRCRDDLCKVERFGPKAFEQAAGFLRIMDGDNPLDRSAVHPEAYAVVEKMAARHARQVGHIIGDSAFLQTLVPAEYTDEWFGVPTVTDIIAELNKPGRDPRPAFKTATFKAGIETFDDLKLNMTLEGTVTNVTHFGAFVDIGVHQDGLVHISALSERFVKDPHTVVKTGDIVNVKVITLDTARRRIGLSMCLSTTAAAPPAATTVAPPSKQHINKQRLKPSNKTGADRRKRPQQTVMGGALAAAFANAKALRK